MEMTKISNRILQCVSEMGSLRKELEKFGKTKTDSLVEYEKAITRTIMKLRNGYEIEFEGETIKNPPISIITKLAYGLCWREQLAKETAVNGYKGVIVSIDSLKTEINSLQSILRNQNEY